MNKNSNGLSQKIYKNKNNFTEKAYLMLRKNEWITMSFSSFSVNMSICKIDLHEHVFFLSQDNNSTLKHLNRGLHIVILCKR